ncbi:MAG: (d)CMP kinase [Pseudomonadota bacterium]
MIIAIDGTVASGKGTLAKRLAEQLALPHLDTGALYRLVGRAALEQGLNLADEETIAAIVPSLDLNQTSDPALRTGEVGQAASKVAALKTVRAALLDAQRAFANQPGGAILDGRDIGTVVCPQADVKLWVEAALETRAKRRHKELTAKGETLTLQDMIAQLKERDERDRDRSAAPMRKAADAVLIDTTDLTIDAAVDKALQIVEQANHRKH